MTDRKRVIIALRHGFGIDDMAAAGFDGEVARAIVADFRREGVLSEICAPENAVDRHGRPANPRKLAQDGRDGGS